MQWKRTTKKLLTEKSKFNFVEFLFYISVLNVPKHMFAKRDFLSPGTVRISPFCSRCFFFFFYCCCCHFLLLRPRFTFNWNDELKQTQKTILCNWVIFQPYFDEFKHFASFCTIWCSTFGSVLSAAAMDATVVDGEYMANDKRRWNGELLKPYWSWKQQRMTKNKKENGVFLLVDVSI